MSYVNTLINEATKCIVSFDSEKILKTIKEKESTVEKVTFDIGSIVDTFAASSYKDNLAVAAAALNIAQIICGNEPNKFVQSVCEAKEIFNDYLMIDRVEIADWAKQYVCEKHTNDETCMLISKILSQFKTTKRNYRAMYLFIMYVAVQTGCYEKSSEIFDHIRMSVKRNPIGPTYRLISAPMMAYSIGGLNLALITGMNELVNNVKHNATMDKILPILSENFHNICEYTLTKSVVLDCDKLLATE